MIRVYTKDVNVQLLLPRSEARSDEDELQQRMKEIIANHLKSSRDKPYAEVTVQSIRRHPKEIGWLVTAEGGVDVTEMGPTSEYLLIPSTTYTISDDDRIIAIHRSEARADEAAANVRDDIIDELREALRSESIDSLKALVMRSADSIFDYLIFVSTAARLVLENPTLLESYQDKLGQLYSSMPREYRYHITSLKELAKGMSAPWTYAYKSADHHFYHYNYFSALHGQEPVTLGEVALEEGDLNHEESGRAAENLLSQELEDAGDSVLIGTLREELGNPSLAFDDLEMPIRIIRFQEGVVESIYAVIVKIRESQKLFGFTLAVARNTSTKSEVVRTEFNELFRRSGQGDLLRVWRLGEAKTNRGRVAAYSSHLMNSSELNYISLGHWAARFRPVGYLLLNSINPFHTARVLSAGDMTNAVTLMAQHITSYYNPEAKTSIKGYSVNAGDANFDLSVIDPKAPFTAKLQMAKDKKLRLTTIAWRGAEENIEPVRFLHNLFRLDWLGQDRKVMVLDQFYIDPETGRRVKGNINYFGVDESRDLTFGDIIRTGVLRGLANALYAKSGVDGVRQAITWLTDYIAEVKRRRLPEDRLFTTAEIDRFLSVFLQPFARSEARKGLSEEDKKRLRNAIDSSFYAVFSEYESVARKSNMGAASLSDDYRLRLIKDGIFKIVKVQDGTEEPFLRAGQYPLLEKFMRRFKIESVDLYFDSSKHVGNEDLDLFADFLVDFFDSFARDKQDLGVFLKYSENLKMSGMSRSQNKPFRLYRYVFYRSEARDLIKTKTAQPTIHLKSTGKLEFRRLRGTARSVVRVFFEPEAPATPRLETISQEVIGALRIVPTSEFGAMVKSEAQRLLDQIEKQERVARSVVKVDKRLAEKAIAWFTNLLVIRKSEGNLAVAFDAEVNESLRDALRNVFESRRIHTIFEKKMSKDLTHEDLEGLNFQFIDLNTYRPSQALSVQNNEALPVVKGAFGANYSGRNSSIFEVRVNPAGIEGEPYLEEVEERVLILSGLVVAGLIKNPAELAQNPAKRAEVRAALLKELFQEKSHPGIVTFEAGNIVIDRSYLLKFITGHLAEVEIREAA